MSFSIVKIVPQQVVAIGDDGKNKSSHLFDDSLETRWSYKGGFAYNSIKLQESVSLDSIVFHWYMKKKERRVYRFGIYLSDTDIAFHGTDFASIQKEIQEMYNSSNTIRSSNDDGNDITNVSLNGKTAKSILIIYTHSSSKKSWFSVKEIQILGRVSASGTKCPDGFTWDPILGECKEIMPDIDETKVDSNGIMFWDDEIGSYLSEDHTFSRNFRTDGSMRMDVEKKDMGGKWRPDKEVVVFLKVSGKNPKEEVSAKLDGGPHNDKNPELGRCYDIGVSFDAKRLRLRIEEKHPNPLIDCDEIDITSLNLPAFVGNWYGFCFTDRRVLRASDKKLLGRLFNVRVNPNPFDWNRNIQNDNWIDIGAFLDKGEFKDSKGKKHPIIEGPVDPEKYTDTIRVDGQDSATFGFRFFRYCQVTPIEVVDEEEMETTFKEIREEFEEDAPQADVNPANLDVEDVPKVIAVAKNGEKIVLHAKVKPNPLITKVYWRQSSGKTIDLPLEMLNSNYVEFEYLKEYGTTEWTFTATAQGGVTVFERTVKILEVIDSTESKAFINPKYKNARENFHYKIENDYKLTVGEGYISSEPWKNVEMTMVLNVGKEKTALPYVFRIGPYLYEIFPDGKYTQWENTRQFMVNVPSFKGKKIGLKIIYMTTDVERQVVNGSDRQKICLAEVHLNLQPDDKEWEYNPWFKVIQQPTDHPSVINISAPMDTKFDIIEIREIQPPSVIRNI